MSDASEPQPYRELLKHPKQPDGEPFLAVSEEQAEALKELGWRPLPRTQQPDDKPKV